MLWRRRCRNGNRFGIRSSSTGNKFRLVVVRQLDGTTRVPSGMGPRRRDLNVGDVMIDGLVVRRHGQARRCRLRPASAAVDRTRRRG
jgi:hypothetical protein